MIKNFINKAYVERFRIFSSFRTYLHKVFNTFMAFMLIFSIAFATIETIDPEPVLASGEFTCLNSDGAQYVFQSTWSGGTLTINRGSNDSNGTFSTSQIETFSSWSHNKIDEVNSLSVDKLGPPRCMFLRG